MKFILNSLNYSPELTGIGKYNGELCPELQKIGYDVSAVVAPPYYPEWKIKSGFSRFLYSQKVDNGVSILRCPLYVPSKVTTIKRLIHLGSFAISSFFGLFSKLFQKPDVVFLVQPTLFCAPAVLLFCKITGAKAVMHIQDYELDALFGLGMMNDGKTAKYARKVECWLLSKFDAVSTISYSMMENAVEKGVSKDKLIFFPNWSDTDFVTPSVDGNALRMEWGFTANDKIALYAGNIGKKQGLELVIQAADKLKHKPAIKFLIVGTGSHVSELKKLSTDLGLTNVFFKPLQPWEKVPEMLAMTDIHLVIQKKGAADAVLPSKLTNILSAGGHALITAEEHTELGQIAENHPGIYSLVEPENIDKFVASLTALLSSDLTEHNRIARNYANEYLAKNKVINNFSENIRSLLDS